MVFTSLLVVMVLNHLDVNRHALDTIWVLFPFTPVCAKMFLVTWLGPFSPSCFARSSSPAALSSQI